MLIEITREEKVSEKSVKRYNYTVNGADECRDQDEKAAVKELLETGAESVTHGSITVSKV